MLYYSNLQGRAVAKLANVAHRKHHSKLNRAVVTYLWPMSLFPPPFLLFSSSQPVFSLPFFFSLFWNWLSSTITKTLGSDWLTGNRRGRAQCDWGGLDLRTDPERNMMYVMLFYSRWETISGWRGLLQKNWLVAFQFCVKWCATQIEKHATCKQMHTRLHFRRGDVCTLGPWPSSVAQDKRSCPTKELYT